MTDFHVDIVKEFEIIKHIVLTLQVKIQSKRTDFSNVNSKIGSRAHMDHKPAGGEKKVGSWLVLNDIN